MTGESEIIEVHNWHQEGYKPLVFSHDWQVALLNWEPEASLANAYQVERHIHSDEVFVLWRGNAALITVSHQGVHVNEMKTGTVYNVPAGVWHTVIASTDSSMVIIENRDTHLNDCEYRALTAEEKKVLSERLPAWAK